MRIFLIFIVLLASINFGARSPEYSIQKSLVSVYSNKSRGTGFVVGSDDEKSYIVTNKHVCRYITGNEDNYSNFVVNWSIYQHVPMFARLIKIDPKHDLCLLAVSEPNLPQVKISKENPYIGQFVKSVGNPEGYLARLVTGKVGSLTEPWFGERVVQFNGDIMPGASGSPVFNEKFEVVGVACGANFKKHNDSVFVNGIYLRKFLGEFNGNN